MNSVSLKKRHVGILTKLLLKSWLSPCEKNVS